MAIHAQRQGLHTVVREPRVPWVGISTGQFHGLPDAAFHEVQIAADDGPGDGITVAVEVFGRGMH